MDAAAHAEEAWVGFIGTGRMGRPLAGHLLRAGYRLVVHDLHPDAAAPLVAAGAAWAEAAADVARQARTVITMVPSSREVELLVGQMLPHLGPGHLLIDMTSADPASTRRLAAAVHARGARMIDAPVSGGVRAAAQATLTIMVGGAAEDVERARPLLTCLGRQIFHMGGPGTGHAMKLVNNVCSAACLTATAEALVVAQRAGIDPARAVAVLSASTGRSDASQRKFPEFILTGRFDSGFALALMDKDLRGFLALAAEVGYEPQVTAAAAAWYRRAMQGPLAEGDAVDVVKLIGFPEERA
jgi:3-hydroxyisobutyrate dehydrogenase